jgi:hypothetical protein
LSLHGAHSKTHRAIENPKLEKITPKECYHAGKTRPQHRGALALGMALAAPLANAARATQPRHALRHAARITAAIVLLAYAIRCVARVPAWDSEATLFAAALRKDT